MLVDETDEAFLRPSTSSRSRSDRESASDRLAAKAVENVGETVPRDDQPFLRTRRRVPVRQGILPAWAKTRWGRIVLLILALTVAGAVIWLIITVRDFLDHDPRFRIDTSASIQTVGNSQLTRDDLLSVFGSDIGRNVFFIPLSMRRAELERIPWVEHATVMRILPNQLRVAVRERTPIAFVRVGDQVELVDAAGVILNMPPAMMAARHFSFPVVAGINPKDPLSVRTPRMQLYQRFIADLDSGGEKISSNLSEIDLSDTEDVRATLPAGATDMLLHFGDEKFLTRYRTYQAHLAEWLQQYPRLASVDLRYDTQVVLKMADGHAAAAEPGAASQPAASTPPKPVSPTTARKHPAPTHKHAGAAE
ncbi:MAG TPA: FtsQ-type POTRA domain-containing protein [Silvibacterium sp.]|nr:FtsQ-type POTRA domain-containing protein [Silvibacterium sp.]